jgi:magnesium transporter
MLTTCYKKVFGIHPLTTEDVLTEESREKCEIFRNYMFVCYRAFNQDHYSADFLKPINFYNIVFKHGIVTVQFLLSLMLVSYEPFLSFRYIQFHFESSPHPHNVRKRARQLKDFINVTSDWINYAIVDDISDSFAPLIKQIEVEVDSIDDLVLLLRESEQSDMLRRIGSCRKMVMHLLRLLSSKAEVVRGLLKRSEDRIREGTYRYHEATTTNTGAGAFSLNRSGTATPTQSGLNWSGRDGALRFMPSIDDRSEEDSRYTNPDVILYFGDIQGMIL